MDLGIEGKRAAVAAASQGLGFATAAALASEGVQVAICSRDQGKVDDAVARIGHGCIGLVADVGKVAGATGFVDAATEALGGVDILVPNAGGPPPGTFAEIEDVDAYARAFELNALSTIAMCRTAVPAMQERGWGRVVAITSISVRQPIANLILSNTARAGLTGFLKTLAREVARDGVTVNSLQPGLHATERMKALHADPQQLGGSVPVGFIGNAGDFGRVAAFLCSESARYVTGTALAVDGGSDQGLQ
jgi:3-oxoacyl-[acyl-carrier protein] reductase